eukprot:9199861-Heterocapsa_arctica.AAC.1
MEVEFEGEQEEVSWEVWLEQAQKRSEENIRKAIEDAGRQEMFRLPAQEVWVTPDRKTLRVRFSSGKEADTRKALQARGCHPETPEEKEERAPFWSKARLQDYAVWQKKEAEIRAIAASHEAKTGRTVPAPPPGKPGDNQEEARPPRGDRSPPQVDRDNMVNLYEASLHKLRQELYQHRTNCG